jgi:hypothetical protein
LAALKAQIVEIWRLDDTKVHRVALLEHMPDAMHCEVNPTYA